MAKVASDLCSTTSFKGEIFFCVKENEYKNVEFLSKEPWIGLDCKILNDEVQLVTIGIKDKYFIFPLVGVGLGTGTSDKRLNFLRGILQNPKITKYAIKCEEQFWALTDIKYDIALEGSFYVDLTNYDSPAGNKAKEEIVNYSSKEFEIFRQLGINWNTPTNFATNRAIHEKLVMIIHQIVENLQYWVKPGEKREPVVVAPSLPDPAPVIKSNVTCNNVDETSTIPTTTTANNVKPSENIHDKPAGGKSQPAPAPVLLNSIGHGVNSSISDPAIIKAKVINLIEPEAKAKSLPPPASDKSARVKATFNEIKSSTSKPKAPDPASTSTYANKLSNGSLSCPSPSPTHSDSSNNSKSSYKILPIKWVGNAVDFDEARSELCLEKVISLDCKLSDNNKICLIVIGSIKKMYLINGMSIQAKQALVFIESLLLSKNSLKLSFKTPMDIIIKDYFGIKMINYLDLNNCQCDEYKGFKFKNSLNSIISNEPQELQNLKFKWSQRPILKDAQLLAVYAASYIIQNYMDIYSTKPKMDSIDVVDGNVLKGSGSSEKVNTNLNASKSAPNQNVNVKLKSNPINQTNELPSTLKMSKSETTFDKPFSVPISSIKTKTNEKEKEKKSADCENNEPEIKINVNDPFKTAWTPINLDKIVNSAKKAEEPQKANLINQPIQVPLKVKNLEISPNISKSDPLILFAKPFSSGPMSFETNDKKKKSPEKKKNEPLIEIKTTTEKATTTGTSTTGTFKPLFADIGEKHIGQGEIFSETLEKMPKGAEIQILKDIDFLRGIGFDKMFDSTIKASLDRIFKHTSAEIIKNNSGLTALADFEESKANKAVQTCFTGEIFCSKFLHDEEL